MWQNLTAAHVTTCQCWSAVDEQIGNSKGGNKIYKYISAIFLGIFAAWKSTSVRILRTLAWRIEKVEEEEPQTAGDEEGGGWKEERATGKRRRKKRRKRGKTGENEITGRWLNKSRDRLQNNAADIRRGESEDSHFSPPFCHFLGRRVAVIVPAWLYHFVLNLPLSLRPI